MFLRTVWIVCILLFFSQPVFAKTVKVALLSIDMAAAGKYKYLGGALNQMIASRLSEEGKVELVDTVLSNKQLARLTAGGTEKGIENIFNSLNSDFVGNGYCYETLDGLKLQMNFFSNVDSADPTTLTMVAANEGEIIAGIDEFADTIKNKVFGFENENLAEATAGVDGLGAFQTAHPERAYKLGVYSGSGVSGEEGGSLVSVGARHSISVDFTMVSLDRGDLNGDGLAELVAVSATEMVVLKLIEGRLQVVQNFSLGKRYKAHRVNLADLNGDGRMEIYVSGNEMLKPSSSVFEWNEEEGLKTLNERIRWYIRPVFNDANQQVLLGQRGSKSAESGFLATGIFILEKDQQSGKYSGWKRYPLPENINLFDFVKADLDGDKVAEIVAIDKNEKMLVYNSANELVWVSTGEYAGSEVHFGPTKASLESANSMELGGLSEEQATSGTYVFIPGRMLVIDVDGNGAKEIVVGKNQYEGIRYLPNLRAYSGGSVACLKWHNGTMAELWKTKKYPGYLSDYAFFFTGSAESASDKSSMKVGRLLVGSVERTGFFGFSVLDKTRLETFSFEMEEGK